MQLNITKTRFHNKNVCEALLSALSRKALRWQQWQASASEVTLTGASTRVMTIYYNPIEEL